MLYFVIYVLNSMQKISSQIELKDNAQAPVKIRYFSRCKNKDGPEIETAICDDLKVGDEVQFRMDITVCSY